MKNKFYLITILQMLYGISGYTQQLFIVDRIPDTISFKTFIDTNGFEIKTGPLPTAGKFPEIKSVQLNESDLEIIFKLSNKKFKYTPEIIKILGIISPGGTMITPLDYKLHINDSNISSGSQSQGIRIWQDVTEDVIRNNQEYKLVIERGIAEEIDCKSGRPVFTSREQWPHLAFAGLGLVSIGVGQIYTNQMNDEYNQYKNAWIAGEERDGAQQYYDKAKNSKSQAEVWTYTGMAIIGIDLILYTYRWYSTKNKQKKWDEFCDPNRTVNININAEPNITGTMTTSLGISVQF